ncbi:Adhesin domain-containing protein [Pleurotus pulmonarius]
MPNRSQYSFNNYGPGNINVFVGDHYATPSTNSRSFNRGNINIVGGNGGRGNQYFSYTSSGSADPPEIQTADDHTFRLPLTRGSMPLRASNYTNVRRMNSSITGCYKIDRTLNTSSGLLELTRSQRSNLSLEALNGSINANIRLVLPQPPTTASAGKALLTASNQNGSTNIRVDPRGPRPPFRLVVSSGNGSVTVHIPRSFHGPVNIQCTNGSIRVSREIKDDLIVLSDDFNKKCFIGDLAGYDGSAGTIQDGWDELSIDAGNGRVGICYADIISEVEEVEDDDVPPTYEATVIEDDDYYGGFNRTSTYSNGYSRTTTYSNPGGGIFNMIFGSSMFR